MSTGLDFRNGGMVNRKEPGSLRSSQGSSHSHDEPPTSGLLQMRKKPLSHLSYCNFETLLLLAKFNPDQ